MLTPHFSTALLPISGLSLLISGPSAITVDSSLGQANAGGHPKMAEMKPLLKEL